MRWLFLKDLQILRRSPLITTLLVLYPVVLAALVGFAVTSGPGKPRVALLNQIPPAERTVNLGGSNVNVQQESQPLFNSIHVVTVSSEAEAIRRVKSGDVLGALVIPPDTSTKLQESVSGNGPPPTLKVYYNAEDPAKANYVNDTIKARIQEADVALSKRVSQAALGYLNLIGSGGSFSFLGQTFDILGLSRSADILSQVERSLPASSPLRAQVSQVQRFAQLAQQNLGLAGPLLESIGTPLQVDTVVVGGSPPLGAFAAAVAVTVTLMFITLLLAAGSLALEREENAFLRLVRGLVTRTKLLVEKVSLAAACSAIVGLLLLAILSAFVSLPWSRLPAWLVALAFAALAFAALGVATGALAREVRAATLLAILMSIPIGVIALVPSGAVSGGLYSVLRVISALFPFRPALDAFNSALGRSGGLGLPLLHLAILAIVFTALARVAVRRF